MNTYDVIFDYIEKLPDGLNQARIALQRHLIEAREAENLTQADVAKRTGLSQQAISRVEHGCGWTVSSLLKYLTGIGYEVNLRKI